MNIIRKGPFLSADADHCCFLSFNSSLMPSCKSLHKHKKYVNCKELRPHLKTVSYCISPVRACYEVSIPISIHSMKELAKHSVTCLHTRTHTRTVQPPSFHVSSQVGEVLTQRYGSRTRQQPSPRILPLPLALPSISVPHLSAN